MENLTVTLYVSRDSEIYFYQILKILNDISIENTYQWRTNDIKIHTHFTGNQIAVNLPIELYIKFRTSFLYNGGNF